MIELLETRYGQMYLPDTDTAQYVWLKTSGVSSEHELIIAVQELLAERERGTFIDVGASFGTWTLALAPYADHIIAFEPQGAIYDLLCRTVNINALNHMVLTSRGAVGSEFGMTQVAILDLDKPSNFGGLSLHEPLDNQPNAPTEIILITTLDQYLDVSASDALISLIKIDVEGSECDALLGAAKTVERCRPLLFVECLHRLTDKDKLRALIDEMGYAIHQRGPNFLALPL
jgi:FkbM family methyltransferase